MSNAYKLHIAIECSGTISWQKVPCKGMGVHLSVGKGSTSWCSDSGISCIHTSFLPAPLYNHRKDQCFCSLFNTCTHVYYTMIISWVTPYLGYEWVIYSQTCHIPISLLLLCTIWLMGTSLLPTPHPMSPWHSTQFTSSPHSPLQHAMECIYRT